jgi:hypothetical protein
MQPGDLRWIVYLVLAGLISGLLAYKAGIVGAILGVFIVWAAMIARIDILFHYRHSSPEANALYFLFGWVPGVFWCGFIYGVRTIRQGHNKEPD